MPESKTQRLVNSPLRQYTNSPLRLPAPFLPFEIGSFAYILERQNDESDFLHKNWLLVTEEYQSNDILHEQNCPYWIELSCA